MGQQSLQMRYRSPNVVRAGIVLLALSFLEFADANVFLLKSAAAIFGGSSNRRDQPPPPPPPREASSNASATVDGASFPPQHEQSAAAGPSANGQVLMYPQYPQQQQQQQQQQQPVETPDPSMGWNMPPPQQQRGPGSPFQQQPPPQWNNNRPSRPRPDPAMFRTESLQRDLDDAMHRERELLAELRNRSSAVAELEQRDRLHMHQLDVLTERVLTVEHLAAQERNEHVEVQANCTALAEALAETSSQVEEWKIKCNELLDVKQKNEKRLQEWKHKWKSAAKEAEDLAIRIEEHHLVDGRERKRKKKKKQGFFAWLFGFGKDELMEQEDDDDFDALHERARTNLLTALKTERKAVGELESVVAALQQNNTAIAEQVKSRDRIIQELNDRVAVFEEDKVVLKAALKQLQKEMNDETPKLEDALKDIDHLTNQIKKLQADHKKELAAVKKIAHQKQKQLSIAEGNLTTIGTYVDKLEERLADFTVAKRDIEKREAESKLADARIKKAEIAKVKLLQRVAELEEEQKELNATMERLVNERSSLQNSTSTLTTQRDEISSSFKTMRETYSKVDEEAKKLRSANDQWALRSEELERQLNTTMQANRVTQEKLNAAEGRLSEMQSRMNDVAVSREENDEALANAASVRNSLQKRIAELEAGIQDSMTQHKKVVDSLQQKLEAEVRQNIVGKDERTELLKKLDQLSLQLKNLEEYKRTTAEQIEKLKEQQPKPVERIEPPKEKATTNPPKLNARPPGAAIAQKPYLPRPADAPKRAFGQGIVNPQDADIEGVTSDLASAAMAPSDAIAMTEDELFAVNATKSQSKLRDVGNKTVTTRKVPLRGFRKFLSKRTGLHGVITPPSSAGNKRKRDTSERIAVEQQKNVTNTPPSTPPQATKGPPNNKLTAQSRPQPAKTFSDRPPHR